MRKGNNILLINTKKMFYRVFKILLATVKNKYLNVLIQKLDLFNIIKLLYNKDDIFYSRPTQAS